MAARRPAHPAAARARVGEEDGDDEAGALVQAEYAHRHLQHGEQNNAFQRTGKSAVIAVGKTEGNDTMKCRGSLLLGKMGLFQEKFGVILEIPCFISGKTGRIYTWQPPQGVYHQSRIIGNDRIARCMRRTLPLFDGVFLERDAIFLNLGDVREIFHRIDISYRIPQ